MRACLIHHDVHAGRQETVDQHAEGQARLDCFYVYPTVSNDHGVHSDRVVGPDELTVALSQAARFSQYCRVFAPMYRQVTLETLAITGNETDAQLRLPISDVRNAFRDYLAHDNHGRGFVLISHSQGTEVMRSVVQKDIDPVPAVRRQLVSALLIGERILVQPRTGIGGSFQHIPACRSARQLGCVISYSAFDSLPPNPSEFGRPLTKTKLIVLCTNPAALGGGAGTLNPIFPSQGPGASGEQYPGLVLPTPATAWLSEPGAYRARCSGAGGAHVLRVGGRGGAINPDPFPDPGWGLHLLDISLGLGNLLDIVKQESAAYAAR